MLLLVQCLELIAIVEKVSIVLNEGSDLPLLFRGLLDIFLSSAILTLLLAMLHLI